MRLCQFYTAGELHIGIGTADGIMDVTQMARRDGLKLAADLDQLLQEDGMEALRAAAAGTPVYVAEAEITFAPVLRRPEKILCAGINYMAHIDETGEVPPAVPVLFAKYNNSLNGHGCDVPLTDQGIQYDYEAELVAVVGKRCKCVSPAEAEACIFGYTCGNDLSVREIQFATSQWLLGKTFDKLAPIGPYLVTADSLDVGDLKISCTVNGEVRQESSTKYLIFNCAQLLSYISQYATLEPGDIIFSGTCGGVIIGCPEDQRVWLKAGDEVQVFIEGIGTLRNKLV